MEAQSHHFEGVGHPKDRSLFRFSGEFSVVALDFDVSGEEVATDALKLKEEIELLCGSQFGYTSFFSLSLTFLDRARPFTQRELVIHP